MIKRLRLAIVVLSILILNGCADGRLLGGLVNVSGIGIGTTDRANRTIVDPLETKKTRKRFKKQKLISLNITRNGDGFIANGKRYIDRYGKTIDVSLLSDTGYITYTIRNPKDLDHESYIVKTKNVVAKSKEVKLGTIRQQDNNVFFTTKNGDVFNGDQFILCSKGLILTRDRTVIMYFSIDSEPKVHVLPEGYFFAGYQKGDVSFSHHIAIQRRIGKAIGLLGTALQNVEEYDVSMFNIETGDITTTFNMQLRGAAEHEQIEHFKNTFYLFNTKSGPITISLEEAYKNVVARNLTTRKKKVLFSREQGVSFVDAGHSSGKIWVKASLGFSDKRINDIERLL